MIKITARSETFLLSDYRSCPDDIDFTMYDRVISKYEELSETGMPVVEEIFEFIEWALTNDLVNEMIGKVSMESPENTKAENLAAAKEVARSAIYQMESGIEEEVMLILARKNLCYKSFSIRALGDDFGVINNPQQELMTCLTNGGDWYGHYVED